MITTAPAHRKLRWTEQHVWAHGKLRWTEQDVWAESAWLPSWWIFLQHDSFIMLPEPALPESKQRGSLPAQPASNYTLSLLVSLNLLPNQPVSGRGSPSRSFARLLSKAWACWTISNFLWGCTASVNQSWRSPNSTVLWRDLNHKHIAISQ